MKAIPTKNELLRDLRKRRDEAASADNFAEALLMNDRIKALRDGSTSVTVESVMREFEQGLLGRSL